jgi:septal ring factor EnvC (AmiA/AmiB activator)
MSITPNVPDSSDSYSDRTAATPRWVPLALIALSVGLAVALVWIYQMGQAGQASQAELRTALAAAKNRADLLANELEQTNQRLAQISGQQQVTSQKLGLTQDELARARTLAQQISQQQQEGDAKLVAQIGEVQKENDVKIGQVSADLGGAKTDIAATQKDLADTKARLTTTIGDLGQQSGRIAHTQEDLDALKRLGERNIYEFNLVKAKTPQHVGPIQVSLQKTDPKKFKYSMTVIADDKSIEKKDRNVAEPLQFYVRSSHTPYEVVVMEVGKDRITGYLSTPKDMTAGAPAASPAAPARAQ